MATVTTLNTVDIRLPMLYFEEWQVININKEMFIDIILLGLFESQYEHLKSITYGQKQINLP